MNSQPSSKTGKFVELITDSFGFIGTKSGENIQVKRFTWKNSNRIQVQAITYGATIISIRYPSKKGIVDDVVLGFEDLQSYMEYQHFYFGSTIGRCANYIKNANFNLLKKDYILSANEGKHHYNGGKKGYSQVIWNYIISGNKVIMTYMSPDGEEGYPGDVLLSTTMELTNQNEFKIEYKAMSTKPTIVNIANHIYFNLAGHSTGFEEVSKHSLLLNSDCYTINGEDAMPTGEIQSVLNTTYDFQTPIKLGSVLNKAEAYNNNFCINRGVEQNIAFIGRLYHAPTGRILEVYSSQFGVQLDTANNLPEQLEPEEPPQKVSKCPYLKAGVTTFDLLDEILNKIVQIQGEDSENDYENILVILQDIIKKQPNLQRTSMNPDGNSGIKRATVTLESLPVFQLTQLQLKYIERILKAIEVLPNKTHIEPLILVLNDVLYNNKILQENVASHEKKMHDDANRFIRGKKGAKYNRRAGICLQCQNFPDAINNTKFPTPILKPGQIYQQQVTHV